MNHIEHETASILEQSGYQIKHYRNRLDIDRANTFYYQFPFHSFTLDFSLPYAKIAIEVDGHHWHTNKNRVLARQMFNHLRDRNKVELLETHGWHLIRLKEATIQHHRDFLQVYLPVRILSLIGGVL